MTDRQKPIKEIDYKLVEKYAAQGMTQIQIAHAIGMSPEWFSVRKGREEKLLNAIRRGQAKGIKLVTNKLFEKALEGNVSCIIFFLKNRGHILDSEPLQWRDRPVEEQHEELQQMTNAFKAALEETEKQSRVH